MNITRSIGMGNEKKKNMKRNILFVFIFAFLAVPFFAQKYVAIDSDYRDMKYGRHGWHYVIENRVNVRDGSGINGNILFQLNAGDKVQIKGYDWDEELYYAGDYYAYWIKISCSRGMVISAGAMFLAKKWKVTLTVMVLKKYLPV